MIILFLVEIASCNLVLFLNLHQFFINLVLRLHKLNDLLLHLSI